MYATHVLISHLLVIHRLHPHRALCHIENLFNYIFTKGWISKGGDVRFRGSFPFSSFFFYINLSVSLRVERRRVSFFQVNHTLIMLINFRRYENKIRIRRIIFFFKLPEWRAMFRRIHRSLLQVSFIRDEKFQGESQGVIETLCKTLLLVLKEKKFIMLTRVQESLVSEIFEFIVNLLTVLHNIWYYWWFFKDLI